MKTITKIVIFFAITTMVMIILYNIASDTKLKNSFDKRNELCAVITNELKNEIDANTTNATCTDYYCYYASYAPPEGYENKTETLCICDCRTPEGDILTSQILSAGIPTVERTK
ncbi:MAG: hypothetical protein PHC66_03940 [Candidatus Nanoarchaeia archaeon]|nr:hypothetical protein [Candidatus Nanoarchaeia archaeon]MDD5239379.1 hypothetical protein [Candidatus Nanoarchaeia archaeon]